MVSGPAIGQTPNRILLVEGQDDKHFVWQLCRRSGSPFSTTRSEYELQVELTSQSVAFKICEKINRAELIKAIPQELKVSGREVVGVLVDADADVGKCWEDIKSAFQGINIDFPPSPIADGTIIPEQTFQPRVGIWLMPDNGSKGELEDFAAKMIPSDDPVRPLSRSYINQIPDGDRKFAQDKTGKAELYSWLAARKEPSRMGAAVGTGDLDVNGSPCQEFLNWLIQLFG